MFTINSTAKYKGTAYVITHMYTGTNGKVICQLAPLSSLYPTVQCYLSDLEIISQ